MNFLRNIWYVAAWADEVAPGAMLARTILNDGIVFFRNASGQAVALADRCPHRLAPLHKGQLKGDVIECGYHGLQFDGRGVCVLNPHGEGQIPPNAKVRSFPVAERHDALWIWMGEPEQANPALIPDFSMVIDPKTTIVRGYLHAPANYELMVDNLLDLGHTAYLHPNSLGSEAIVHSTRSTSRDGDRVVYELWAPDGDAPLATQMMMPWYQGKKVDHWMVSTWNAPGLIHQETGTAPAGSNREGGNVSNGLHWLTPETDSTTHYFQALSRSFRLDDPQLDEMIRMGVKQAFTQEDFPMVGAIQNELGGADIMDLRPVILSIDAGAVLARNILRQKLRTESEGGMAPTKSAELAGANA